MPLRETHPDAARMADNLCRAIELTQLGLALRQAVLDQTHPQTG